ncbi:MAG: alginate export family protein, partial [Gammaproteobacteria bacterium]
QGAAREERHTVGVRFFGKRGSWDFNQEAIYQFGRFGSGAINAWSVATDHGCTLENVWGKPRLGLKAAIASGDRGTNSANLQTLNPLFPRGNYFTEASLLGPQNFWDVHPCLQLRPFPKWSFETGADFYWRESLHDGIYTPGGSVIYRGDPNLARFVGTDLSCVIGWQATRHINISAGYTHFFAGRFIRQNGGEHVNYGTVWASYKF